IRTVPREHLWNVQTPQVFRRDLLEKAYEQAVRSERQFTDDAAVVEAFTALKIRLVSDPYPNPKLTYPEDLSLIEKLS
ncbi:MAG: 2-C-methyl-D-erythritol 4-phosphate cytidylyltransferase, partial [Lentisphaeria bacterium]|nr:2-C-methyl-D-erythritol 4-phosphate cytidylyltransferase [Lentisphaeria bacterium]